MSKVLTVSNPYGYLICTGEKTIENRTWKTNYRGKILIHASAKWHARGRLLEFLFTPDQFNSLSRNSRAKIVAQAGFKYGAIIGEATIVDCVQGSKDIWAEKGQGIYHWVLANAKLYTPPIENIKGKLQLWNLPFCESCTELSDRTCERCERDMCDGCQSSYNIHTQIDYNCCESCAESERDY